MEKLKNLVNPGSKKDDEVMYGSGRSDDPVHTGDTSMGNTNTGSGQGSHFSSSRTAGHDPLSTSSNPTGTSQFDSGTTGGASHGLSEPYASRTPGGFDNDDAATTASVSSGVPGQSQSRSAMTGANDPTFTDKPLPPEPASETGLGQSSLTGNSYPDRSIGNNPRYGDQSRSSHLGRDAALGAGAVGTSTHRHEDPQRDNYAPETGRSFPLGGNSASNGHGSTTAGPHSSNLANNVDPRVDSDGSRAMGDTGYGSTSGGYGSGTGATPSSGNQGSLGRNTLGAEAGAGAGAVGSGTTTGTGYGPESWQHEHQRHGHQYEGDPCEIGEVGGQEGPHFVSGPHITDTANRLDPHVGSGIEGAATTGDSSGHHHHGHHGHRGEEAALVGGAGAAGMGALEADRSKQRTTGNTTSAGLDSSNTDRHGLDTTGGGAYDNERHTATGVSSTGKTAGPHKSDMLNKLDPRVDSDLSKQQRSHGDGHHYERDAALTGAGGAGVYEAEKHHRGNDPSLATSSTTASMGGSQGRHHHAGRDAALTGAGGAGLYEAEKHYRRDEPNLATSSNTSGMGGQSLYDSGVDPRVDPTRSGMGRDESAVSSAGSGHQSATSSDHHYKRDAGLAGAGGIGAYEAENHSGSSDRSGLAATPQDQLAGSGHQPAIATRSSPYPSSGYGDGSQPQTGNHTERNPLAASGVGAGATGGVDEAQKMRDYARTDPETRVQEHQHPGASIATYSSPDYGNDTEKRHHIGRHTGRDAALVGGAGAGAGALADHEYSHRDVAGYGNEPYQEASRGHHIGRDTAAVGGAGTGAGALAGHEHSPRDAAGYGTEPYQDTSREHHTGRDAAILGGAAGAGGLAEHEYSKKDAEKLQKEHAKEEKALEKEHSKEVKQHNKELAKEEKAHEKAIEKSEKKHEKTMGKDEKKHEKAIGKDEKKQDHGEKKHGGLLGFLHRDKPDKELKEEEARRQGAIHPSRGEEEMAAGAGAIGLESRSGYDPLQGEHGSQSGVHDTPIGIGSGPTTHDAYGPHDSGHNKLHKDPPAKIAESRGFEFQ